MRMTEQPIDLKRTIATFVSNPNNSYVYIIREHSNNGLVKIGKANDIKKRMSTLRVASAHDFKLLHQIRCNDSKEALLIEKNLHIKYSEFRMKREWFTFTEDMLSETRTSVLEFKLSITPNVEGMSRISSNHFLAKLSDLMPDGSKKKIFASIFKGNRQTLKMNSRSQSLKIL